MAPILVIALACADADGDLAIAPTIDVDQDGILAPDDCDDYDAAVRPAGIEACWNGLDDDCNGAIDCDDEVCATEPRCAPAEICGNGLDDDRSGAADCEDPACFEETACAECVAGPVEVGCDSLISTSVQFGTAQLDAYPDSARAWTGNELLYAVTLPFDAELRVKATPAAPEWFEPGLDVALFAMVGACHTGLTVASADASGVGGLETLAFDVRAFEDVFIAVEDGGGGGDDVDLEIACGGP